MIRFDPDWNRAGRFLMGVTLILFFLWAIASLTEALLSKVLSWLA